MWLEHETLGPQFKQLLDQIVEKYGPKPSGDAAEGEKKKRKIETSASEEGTAPKKLKAISEVDATDMVTFALVKQPGVAVRICAGNHVYIQNSGAQDVTMKKSTVVAGFGKGSFVFEKDKAADAAKTAAKDIPYRLVDSSTEARVLPAVSFLCAPRCSLACQVIFKGALTSLGKLVAEQKKQDPNCKIQYFHMEAAPTAADPYAFTCQQSFDLRFVGEQPEARRAGRQGQEGQPPAYICCLAAE